MKNEKLSYTCAKIAAQPNFSFLIFNFQLNGILYLYTPQRHPRHSPSGAKHRGALRAGDRRREPRRASRRVRTGAPDGARLFKGTERRKAWQVNCRLENLGGELNAFTTKEDTTIHATTLKGDFAKAAELIADIAFRSTFPDRELEREKEVIVDEINTYKDSPADLIYDTFEDMLFEGSELGHNILGRKASLMRYDGQAIRAFTARTHTTDQMVFSSIGNFSAKTAEAVAARYFASQPASQRGFVRAAPAPYRAFEKTVSKHTHQTHCIIGSRAFGISEDRRLPLALVTNILGGPCANSLLNVVVREKNGLSYNIEASYTPYGDTGIVAIYFSSDHSNAEQCIELIEGQLHKLRTVPLTARQLSMAKNSSSPSWPYRAKATKATCSGRAKACSSTTASTPWSRSTPRSAP